MQWRTTPQASSYWRLPSKETARLQAALRDSATRVSSTVYRSSRAISHITSRSFRPRSQKWVLGQFDCGGNLHKKSRPNKLQLRRPYSERREASGYSGAAIDEDDPDHQLEDGQGTGDHGTSAAARPRRRGHRIGRSTSGIDAVDGSSTGTSVPWMWALLRLPRFRGANHADDNDNRFRHRQVSFPG